MLVVLGVNMELGVVALVFRCRPTEGEPSPTREAVSVAWLDASEVDARMDEAYAIRVLDALGSRARQAAIRAHDGAQLL